MIPQDLTGRPTTPTEFAKQAVLTWGDGSFYWKERVDHPDRVTDREAALIDQAVKKQFGRVEKFLGLE